MLPSYIVLNVLALHCYPIGRTVATAEALFQNKSLDLHARDSLSFTLLYHLATFKPGDCDLSAFGAWLVNRFPDLLSGERATYALLLAAFLENTPIAKLLIACGADYLAVNETGNSVLSLVITSGKISAAAICDQILKSPGFNPNCVVNARGDTALRLAMQCGNVALVDRLIARGAVCEAPESPGAARKERAPKLAAYKKAAKAKSVPVAVAENSEEEQEPEPVRGRKGRSQRAVVAEAPAKKKRPAAKRSGVTGTIRSYCAHSAIR